MVLLAAAVVVGVASRLYLATAYHGNFDEDSYEIVAAIMRHGGIVYAETDRYNYSPVWADVIAALDGLGDALRLELHTMVRSFLTFVDVGVAILVGMIAARTGSASFAIASASYLLNPVAILLVGYHGQFENLAALPLLAAAWAALQHPDRRTAPIWLLASAALVIKQLMLFGVWTVIFYAFSRQAGSTRSIVSPLSLRPLAALALAVLAFLATFVPYWGMAGTRIVSNVLGYTALPRLYGLGAFLPYEVAFPIFLATLSILPLVMRDVLDLDLTAALRLSAIALLALIPGIGEQYFLIPIIFGAAHGGAWFWTYSAAATLFLLSSPNNVHLLQAPPLWNLVWAASFIWLAATLLRSGTAAATRLGS